eukprot:gene4135-8220_t
MLSIDVKSTISIDEPSYSPCSDVQSMNYQGGRWSAEEHELFLEGYKIHKKNWKKLATLVKTRTAVQIRTHAQKFFGKLGLSGPEKAHIEKSKRSTYDDKMDEITHKRQFLFQPCQPKALPTNDIQMTHELQLAYQRALISPTTVVYPPHNWRSLQYSHQQPAEFYMEMPSYITTATNPTSCNNYSSVQRPSCVIYPTMQHIQIIPSSSSTFSNSSYITGFHSTITNNNTNNTTTHSEGDFRNKSNDDTRQVDKCNSYDSKSCSSSSSSDSVSSSCTDDESVSSSSNNIASTQVQVQVQSHPEQISHTQSIVTHTHKHSIDSINSSSTLQNERTTCEQKTHHILPAAVPIAVSNIEIAAIDAALAVNLPEIKTLSNISNKTTRSIVPSIYFNVFEDSVEEWDLFSIINNDDENFFNTNLFDD